MAEDRERIIAALRNAHNAGDVESARRLAAMLQQPQKDIGHLEGLGAQYAQGAAFGFGDELGGAIGASASYLDPRAPLAGQSFGERYEGIRDAARGRMGAYQQANPGKSIAANIVGSLGTGGLGASKLAGLTGGKLIAGSAGLGGLLGGTAGAGLSEADTAGGVAKDAALSGLLGAATGAAFPAAGQAIKGLRNRVVSGTSTPAYRQAVGVLDDAKVPLTSGQKLGANWLKSAERTLSEVPVGGKPLQSSFEGQRRSFQRKLFQMIGLDDADMLTRENLDRASDMFAKQYTKALAGKTVDLADDAFIDDLARIESVHSRFIDDPAKRKVKAIVSEFLDDATSGAKTGKWYQEQRSLFAKRAMRNTEVADLYDDLKSILDDAFKRSAGPVKQDLDSRYAQYKQLQELFKRVAGGPEGAEGFIPPGQLARIAERNPGSRQWKEFARAAAAVLPDRMGNSGTAQRSMFLDMIQNPIGGLLGTGFYAPAKPLAMGVDVTGLMFPGAGVLQNPKLIAPAALAGGLLTQGP